MSESDKRKPISVYLTPRAAMILQDYNAGSGYGSVSRTVEEIILAFDSVYRLVKKKHDLPPNLKTVEDRAKFYTLLMSYLQNIENSISRLTPSSQITRVDNV